MLLQNLQAEIADTIIYDTKQSLAIKPSEHLEIHRQRRFAVLIRCLLGVYPLVKSLVGADFFQILTRSYIEHYPSRSGNLYEFGEYMSEFIAEFQPLKNMAYLIEVARFEWLCHTLLCAPNASASSADLRVIIENTDANKLSLCLHPAAQVRRFYYPILRIIEKCEQQHDEAIDMHAGGDHLLIIRHQFNIALIPLTVGEFVFLDAIQDELSMAEARSRALRVDREFQYEEVVSRWIDEQVIVGANVQA